MDANSIIQVISTVGFPIAMCLMMAWYIKTINQSYRDDIKSIQKSIDNNTAVIEKLSERLEVHDNVTRN